MGPVVTVLLVMLGAAACSPGPGSGIARETTDFLRGMGIEIAFPATLPDDLVTEDRLEQSSFAVEVEQNLNSRELMGSDMQLSAMSGPGSESLGFRPVEHEIVYVGQWWYRDQWWTPPRVRAIAIFDGQDGSVLGFWRLTP